MFSTRLEDILQKITRFNAENYEDSLRDLKNVLRRLNQVRLLMYPGPGMGHQASTFHVLMRIIDLGFRGTAEVCYHKDNVGIVARLIPNFDSAAPDKPIPLGGATVLPKAFSELPLTVKEMDLGFSGGVDWQYYEENNFATKIKVKYFLGLQPYRWIISNVIQGNVILTEDRPANQLILDDRPHPGVFKKRAFYQAPPQMTEEDYARFSRSEYRGKSRPYRAVVELLQAKSIHLMPVYGVEIFEEEYKANHPEAESSITSEMVLFNLLTGILYAQDSLNHPKSVVVPVMATLTDNANDGTYKRLFDLFSGTSAAVGRETKFAGYLEKNLERFIKRIRIIPFDSPNFNQVLNMAVREKNHVVVIKMGSLPLYAFNYLYGICDLPGVFEGQGTANLLLNLGKPYFQLPSHNNQVNESHADLYPTLPLTASPGAMASDMLKVVRMVVATASQWNGTTDIDVTVGNFLMVVILGGETPLMNYFRDLGAFFHNPAEDKFLQGAFYFFNYIQGRIQREPQSASAQLQQLFTTGR